MDPLLEAEYIRSSKSTASPQHHWRRWLGRIIIRDLSSSPCYRKTRTWQAGTKFYWDRTVEKERMNNRNSSYAVTARQYEIRSEDQNKNMNTGLILGQCRRQECQQQWRNSAKTNVGRTNKCRETLQRMKSKCIEHNIWGQTLTCWRKLYVMTREGLHLWRYWTTHENMPCATNCRQ